LTEKLTPLMQQYYSIKEKHPNEVLFFRLGDFYEMFDSDAKQISKLLNLTLTHRGASPMCGIPFHAAKNYIKRLLDAGKKIAICEQLEIAGPGKALVKRDVIQVITPATVVEDEFLTSGSYNFLLSLFGHNASYCDISTGDFFLKRLDEKNKISSIQTLIEQIMPSEVLINDDEYFLNEELRSFLDQGNFLVTKLPNWYFSNKNGEKLLKEYSINNSYEKFLNGPRDKLKNVCLSLLRYIKATSKATQIQYFDFKLVNDKKYLQIDESSRKNLELFTNNFDSTKKYSLFETIDKTTTSAGQRMLKQWLSFPLYNIEEIIFRQDWVKFFIKNDVLRKSIQEFLNNSMDIKRLTNRIVLKRAKPFDLVGIKYTLKSFLDIYQLDSEKFKTLLDENIEKGELEGIKELIVILEKSINEENRGPFVSGKVILDGFDKDLDAKRNLINNHNQIFDDYLNKIKKETGINNLKLVNSRVSGYCIEVSKGQLDKVPEEFTRKQTLVNSERFTTKELYEFEKQAILNEKEAETLEKEIYEKICNFCSSKAKVLNLIGNFLSIIDCFQSLSNLAIEKNYNCPIITNTTELTIIKGRHPVVENNLPPGSFVANDTVLNPPFVLMTGPNMAGKSTYLRQNALIVLLAQIGSFIPAEKAVIGLTDKIFCRVGASDNLARGESTFLVEMKEASFIIRTCTKKSLVIMDEIGRGTSTQDGMSIAYAIIDYLKKNSIKTLFATHYHELTYLGDKDVNLLTLEVSNENNQITFLRKVIPGVAKSSYALQVAKMAGMPYQVLKNASKFQKEHFADYSLSGQRDLFIDAAIDSSMDESEEKLRLINEKQEKLLKDILNLDLDNLSPFQALIMLSDFKEKIKCLLEDV